MVWDVSTDQTQASWGELGYYHRRICFSEGFVSVTFFKNELSFPNAMFHTTEHNVDVICSCLTFHGTQPIFPIDNYNCVRLRMNTA